MRKKKRFDQVYPKDANVGFFWTRHVLIRIRINDQKKMMNYNLLSLLFSFFYVGDDSTLLN